MSITDELRKVAAKTECANGRCEKLYRGDLDHIADRIDQEHEECEGFARRLEDAAKEGAEVTIFGTDYIPLPKGADGEPIRIGELVDEKLPFGGYAAPAPIDTMELSRGASGYGWMVKLDAENRAFISPKLLRHHHEPTVEDVLREMVAAYMDTPLDDSNDGEFFAEYATKLRLAGEDA